MGKPKGKGKGNVQAVKDILTDPNVISQIEDALHHSQFIRNQLKVTYQKSLTFRDLQVLQKDMSMDEKVSLLSHNIQKDIWEKIKDLEETTKNLRNAMGILDPEGAFNSDDFQLNRLDVEISSIRPLPQI